MWGLDAAVSVGTWHPRFTCMGAPDGMYADGLLAARPTIVASTADVHACSLAVVPQIIVSPLMPCVDDERRQQGLAVSG